MAHLTGRQELFYSALTCENVLKSGPVPRLPVDSFTVRLSVFGHRQARTPHQPITAGRQGEAVLTRTAQDHSVRTSGHRVDERYAGLRYMRPRTLSLHTGTHAPHVPPDPLRLHREVRGVSQGNRLRSAATTRIRSNPGTAQGVDETPHSPLGSSPATQGLPSKIGQNHRKTGS